MLLNFKKSNSFINKDSYYERLSRQNPERRDYFSYNNKPIYFY